jgi:hypothetical protein
MFSSLRTSKFRLGLTLATETSPIFIVERPVSTKTVHRELHESNIHGRAAIAEPLITERNAQMRKRRFHDQETWA